MSVSIRIEGLDKIAAMVSPARFERAAQRGLERSSQVWRDETKKMPPVSAKTTGYDAIGIPVDTGRLRQSIQARQVSAVAAEVYAPVQYADAVHDGSSRVPARPFLEWSADRSTEKFAIIFSEELLKTMN